MEDYQSRASRTLIDRPDFDITDEQIMIVWNAVGLAGEAGEVVDTIKKAIFHQQGLDVAVIEKELGDVLWYVAALCTKLNLRLTDVMRKNIEKLEKRYPNGYNPRDSGIRADLSGVDWNTQAAVEQAIGLEEQPQ